MNFYIYSKFTDLPDHQLEAKLRDLPCIGREGLGNRDKIIRFLKNFIEDINPAGQNLTSISILRDRDKFLWTFTKEQILKGNE